MIEVASPTRGGHPSQSPLHRPPPTVAPPSGPTPLTDTVGSVVNGYSRQGALVTHTTPRRTKGHLPRDNTLPWATVAVSLVQYLHSHVTMSRKTKCPSLLDCDIKAYVVFVCVLTLS